jgi:hypothetical protein
VVFLNWNSAAASALALAAAGILSACGGGGNEAGLEGPVETVPSDVTVSGDGVQCAVGPGPKVYVYGGEPPYALKNSAPLAMTLDKTRVEENGQAFTITFINGVCMDSMPITIVDDLGTRATLAVSNTP